MLILILVCVGMVLLFIGIGLKIMNSTYPVQYMANANELPKISDIKGYNHALGKTFIGFGCILMPIFIPLFLPAYTFDYGLLYAFLDYRVDFSLYADSKQI